MKSGMFLKGLLACAILAMVTPKTKADEYSKWVKDEKQQTYTCTYSYQDKQAKPAQQTVVVHYGDKDRQNFAYYYNAKNEPWGRCTIAGSNYNPKAMYWEHLSPKKDSYVPYESKDYCPTPANGRNPIPMLPLPPK